MRPELIAMEIADLSLELRRLKIDRSDARMQHCVYAGVMDQCQESDDISPDEWCVICLYGVNNADIRRGIQRKIDSARAKIQRRLIRYSGARNTGDG